MVTATGLWWVATAERAPTFLASNPALPVNARLLATVALMALAAAAATAGAVRIGRSLPEWRRKLVESRPVRGRSRRG